MRLLHLDWERSVASDPDAHFRLTFGTDNPEDFLSAMDNGLYEHVADVEGLDLEYIFAATQNGVMTDSWSRLPPENIKPVNATFIHNGEELGFRSTSVGDVLDDDGTLYYVDRFGFKELRLVSGPRP